MTRSELTKALHDSGWRLEDTAEVDLPQCPNLWYRARQRGMITPWRENLEQVMGDVRAMSELPENCNEDKR